MSVYNCFLYIQRPMDRNELYLNLAEKPAINLTFFELNLETWRQLWRVIEMSDILLVIVDIRCVSLLLLGFLKANLMTENGNVKIIKYRYILKIIGLGM